MSKRPPDCQELVVFGNKKHKVGNDIIEANIKQIVKYQKKHSLKAPILLLTGHEAEVLSCEFSPSGEIFASCSSDRCIFLWKASGNCKNISVYNAAHSNSILDLKFTSNKDSLITCSADKTVVVWDLTTGCRLKKLRCHQSFVNSVDTCKADQDDLLVSVGDDGQINIWDLRQRYPACSLLEKYPLTSVSFNKQNDEVFVAGIENTIHVWDLRKQVRHFSLVGHQDTITGLSLSPDGNHLLSNSMDNTAKSWDVRNFSGLNRLEKTFVGHQHNFEKNLLRCSWSADGQMVSAGSADRNVCIWSYFSNELLYKLPGHKGSVNEVAFSPIEPLVLSCSSDKQLMIGEIDQSLI